MVGVLRDRTAEIISIFSFAYTLTFTLFSFHSLVSLALDLFLSAPIDLYFLKKFLETQLFIFTLSRRKKEEGRRQEAGGRRQEEEGFSYLGEKEECLVSEEAIPILYLIRWSYLLTQLP